MRAEKVMDGQKCAVPTGRKVVVLSLIQAFAHEFAGHVDAACPSPRALVLPKLVDHDEEAGRFLYDRAYENEPHDWAGSLAGTRRAI